MPCYGRACSSSDRPTPPAQTSDQRRSLRREALQAQWQTLQDKLQELRQAIAIEADVSRKFQLKHQIQTGENELAQLGQQLEALEAAIDPERSPVAAAGAAAGYTPDNLMLPGAIVFVGREKALEDLHELLQQDTPVAICAVRGMGGIGKTELALQYAYQQRDLGTYPGGICWLSARQDLKLQVVAFARSHLDLEPPLDLDLDGQLRWCWQRWGEGPTLLIVDDVQTYAEVEALQIPARSPFKRLLTTRSPLGASVRTLNLEVLSQAAALELLAAIVPDGRVEAEGETAQAICAWLGYLPLGVELVARYLARKPDLSLARLQERLEAQRLEAKALKEREPGMTASLGVAAAFELSWQALPPAAQPLAAFLSLSASAEIPWSLVQAGWSEQDEEDLEDLRDDHLVGLSLLKRTEAGHYQLHQLLREFFAAKRQQMPEDAAMRRSVCQVMVAVAQQIPQTPTLSQIEQTKPAIPHLQETATTLYPTLLDAELIIPANRIAWFYAGQAAYAEAEVWYDHCLAIAIERLGAEHPDTATSLNNLALLYKSQERYSEAEPLYLRSLQIKETQLGAEHPDTASSLNNLAALYESQGRYSEAEPLLVRSIAILEKVLPENHPDLATVRGNLTELRSQMQQP